MSEVTKKDLSDTIKNISTKIDEQIEITKKQTAEINELKSKNSELQKRNQETLDQIKEYIEELEQIRSHYVDNNNRTSK